jgi:branched-chain amino acid transport system substrate-binding protein
MKSEKAKIGRKRLAGVSRRKVLHVAAVAATSSFWFNIARAAEEKIKIGFPVPLTGPYGAEAKQQAACAQIAVDDFNAAGGLNGNMAELLVRDTKLNAGEAATRTLELIEKDQANCVVGSLSAAVQLAINNVTKARKVLYVSISQSDQITAMPDFSRYTFHEALNPHMTAGAVARYALTKFGKKVVFLTPDYAFGHELVNGYQAAGKELGMEMLDNVLHPIGATDFSTFFPRIQSLHPDVMIVNNFGRDQLNALKQAASFGLNKQMHIVVSVLLYGQRLAGGPDAFDGVVGGSNYYWRIEDQVPSAKRFNEAYRKRNDDAQPSDYGAYGYAGTYAILSGIKKAGTTDTEKVIDALEENRYDPYKGIEYYRKCDHQAVQSVLILESKPKAKTGDQYDVFDIVQIDPADEKKLRSCAEEGHG